VDALAETVDKALSIVSRVIRFLLKAITLFVTVWMVLCAAPLSKPSDFGDVSGSTYVSNSVAGFTLHWLISHLLPPGETLIAAGPFDAFTTVMMVGAGLAFILTMPYLVYTGLKAFKIRVKDPETGEELEGDSLSGTYRDPATGKRLVYDATKLGRQGTVRNVLLMAVGFFMSGVVFGLWILPTLYLWGYMIQTGIGISGAITLAGFLGTTALFTIGIGLMFQVPTVAYLLSSVGILTSPMMKRVVRPAALLCVFAAFLISPGVGWGLIEFPMAGLFFGLYLLAYRIVIIQERRRASRASRPMGVADV
jgi:Sec-independent protein secretion pathway component TatC